MVNYNSTLMLHGYGDGASSILIFWGSRDVIGHMTIGLTTYGFL